MRNRLIAAVVLALPVLSGGCVAKTAWNVATAPVKAAGQVADWSTTSQDEADRNYGREMREKEAREGRERRKYQEYCEDHPDCGPYTGYRASQDDD
ncbi:hypothetical protein [Stakelama saccharophila]|uniref:Lipoprotein n=1 Tax=Stakelama saccharophila TaxID=3075605 RepID=A0ABZ0BAY4_9SPHN|nr:hypothetical protein [Stakelama sp. W311]WNO54438.1 hypothetical protein RPR59_04070 [Stakelama sp. W311]